ncbi:MAG: metallophosphoesterase family protein [Chloroflexota bacterium]
MRYAILADIHSNLEAFQAVLADIEHHDGVSEVWCLGDIVGYGPDPHECIELLRQYQHISVAGNHDFAAIGKLDTLDFNPDAAYACQWTGTRLTPEDIEYLGNLPLKLIKDDFTLVHGSPRDPLWEYLVSPQSAEANFVSFATRVLLVGHSHIPLAIWRDGSGEVFFRYPAPGKMAEPEKTPLILNPGSVGQPRNGDPRASYATLDTGTGIVDNRRVPYDIQRTQGKMLKQQLPLRLITRLSHGV